MEGRAGPRRLLGLLLVLAAASCDDDDDPTGPSTPQTRHLLVVTHSTQFPHASIPTAEATLAQLAQESGGAFDVTYCRNEADVASLMTTASLQRFHGVFFANTSGDLGIPDLGAFLDWIAAGHAFLGTHSASATYGRQDAYGNMLGAEFITHGIPCEVELRVEDASHPAGAPLFPTFRVFDEIYEFDRPLRGSVSVLLSLDHHPPDGHQAEGQPGDFPISWHKMHGAGRVFYTALGHYSELWTDPRFQAHLGGAISWSLEGTTAGAEMEQPARALSRPAPRARRVPQAAPQPFGE